jgi:hypothetical protein
MESVSNLAGGIFPSAGRLDGAVVLPTIDTIAAERTVTGILPESVSAAKPPFTAVDAVTVIVAVPAATAVMTPVGDTVATPGVVVLYVNVATGAPDGCETRAVIDCVCPTVRTALAGERATDAIAGSTAGTVTVAIPCTPSTVATIFTRPGAKAVTNPPLETDAMPGPALVQTTGRPVSNFPALSRTVGTRMTCAPPTDTVMLAGVTATERTTARGGGGSTGGVTATTRSAAHPQTPSARSALRDARQNRESSPEGTPTSAMNGGIARTGNKNGTETRTAADVSLVPSLHR